MCDGLTLLMIPLRDDNPTTLTPFVTVGLIILNCLVFVFQVLLGPQEEIFVLSLATVPAELFHLGAVQHSMVPPWLTLFTSMFIHGNLMHLAGNMLYLWIFGNNIEDVLGHGRFLLFFLLIGAVASFSHAVVEPTSTIPMVGASGAISGILGAYVLLFPYARVQVLIPIGIFPYITQVSAVVVLGLWIVVQALNAIFNLGGVGGGVAWFAHVGGFAAGLLLIKLFAPLVRERAAS
jgi:membrane associated rhomboid family serine protease